MKNHIALKFIAVLLAALSLLAALGSAVGIVALTVSDLYDRTVDELYEEQMESRRRSFAVNLIHRYASLNLGNLPEGYLDEYYGFSWQYDTFQSGYFFYIIRDQHGAVVESTLSGNMAEATRYEISVTDLRYRRLIPEDAEALQPVTNPEDSGDDISKTETPGGTETEAAEDVAVASEASSQEIFEDGYYDYGRDTYVTFRYEYADLPPYTVELYLLPGAIAEEYMWTLLELVWNYRDLLFYVLVGGLLAFAVFAVYLCCAAGRKPGSSEVRAAGLNCIPLDLYAVGGAGIISLIAVLSQEVLYYLLREGSHVVIHYAVFAGFAVCLIFVCFCFACAAQFKTPGGYWYRNTFIGHCLRLLVWLWNEFAELCVRLGKVIPACVVWLGKLCKHLLLALWKPIRNAFYWCVNRIARVYGMLPLIWQWLLTAAVMLILSMIAFSARDGGWLVLSLMAYAVIVIYAAGAFGILYEGAKKMRQGDLESKIHDRYLIGSFKDFSEELNGLADVAMIAAQDKLKSERMKTELITNVSHDIKTPLTSIINYVDLMEKPHTPEEQDEYLEVLSRQSLRLKKLIDDLMEMSKASTGNLSVEITEIDAVEAVNQALGEFGDKLEKVGLTPVLRTPETPVMMKADGKLLWRVLSNLLSNAVKYALPGTRLYIDLMELDGKAVISLKNISREELNVSAEELMERFVRGDASRNTEGSGLGLNIAQSLMELQKGQLQLLVDGDLFKVTLTFPTV